MDEFVGHVGTVKLRRIDVIDAGVHGSTKHSQCLVMVSGLPQHAWTRKLHGAKPHAVNGTLGQEDGIAGHSAHIGREGDGALAARIWRDHPSADVRWTLGIIRRGTPLLVPGRLPSVRPKRPLV